MDFNSFKSKYQKEEVIHFPANTPTHPVVSVIVLTFEHKNFIKSCLDSILHQKTDFPFEILLGEDASTDGTREICVEYAKKYSDKIRLFLHHPNNKIKVLNTTTGNFNALYTLFSAKGEFLAFCEGDDYWNDPLKLQKQYDFMKMNPKFSVCYHNYKIVNSKNKYIISKKASPLKEDLRSSELTLAFRHPATLTIFIRKQVVTKVPKEITKVLAIDVFLNSLLGQFGSGKYLNHVLPSSYRVHDGGLWSNMSIGPKLIAKINTNNHLSLYYDRIGNKKISKLLRKHNIKIKLYLLLIGLRKGQLQFLSWLFKT